MTNTKKIPTVHVSHVSENAILLKWPDKMCEEQHQHIIECQQFIQTLLSEILIDSIASYASLIIYYRFDLLPINRNVNHNKTKANADITNTVIESSSHLEGILQKVAERPLSSSSHNENASKIIDIPVYYGEDAGWDIQSVAEQTKLSVNEVITKHTQKIYRAFALGFTPGFCYLGQLSSNLQLPRKSTPRLQVPKGAVAIAEQQTAIYPNNSPGGWHIIGQTPLVMTNVQKNEKTDAKTKTQTKSNNFHSTINVGDSVKFTAITKEEFLLLGGNIQLELPLRKKR